MVGIIAKARIKDGTAPQFEKVAQRLVEAVKSNEPDCLLYVFARSQEDASLYLFVERYKDQAACQFHTEQEYFRTLGGALFEFMEGAPEIIQFDEI